MIVAQLRRWNSEGRVGYPSSTIAHCSLSTGCHIAYDALLFPNGLARGPDDTLYVASTLRGTVSQLAMDADGDLSLLQTITVPGRALDNVHVEPDGGIYVAAIPIMQQFVEALRRQGPCATEVWRISNETSSASCALRP
jgi:sugar lactone lactonase YvrE